jgi:hypothetical protein
VDCCESELRHDAVHAYHEASPYHRNLTEIVCHDQRCKMIEIKEGRNTHFPVWQVLVQLRRPINRWRARSSTKFSALEQPEPDCLLCVFTHCKVSDIVLDWLAREVTNFAARLELESELKADTWNTPLSPWPYIA